MQNPVRFLCLLTALAIGLCLLSYRIITISFLNRAHYLEFINAALSSHEIKKATRGSIVDRHGEILAITSKKIEIGIDPCAATEQDRDKIPDLAKILGLEEKEILRTFEKEAFIKNGKKQSLRWKKIATIKESSVYEKFKSLGLKCAYGIEQEDRCYPGGQLACHVIGFVNKEGEAICGIEKFVDKFLKGKNGWIDSEKDGLRKEIALFRKSEVNPKNGSNVELTISIGVQNIAEKVLADAIQKTQAPKGSIIISNPTSGEILALCNFPAFDCNEYSKTEIEFLQNRAITSTYEPDSIFEIVPFGLALQNKIISPEEIFDCSLQNFSWNDQKYVLPEDVKDFETLNAVDVFKKYSRYGIAQIGVMLGEEMLFDGAKSFGFGARTGYGFDCESPGIFRRPKNYNATTLVRLATGHSINVTSIQIHQAMGVIASGGFLLKPKIIRKIYNENGINFISEKPYIIRQVLTEEVARYLQNILKEKGSEVDQKIGSLAYRVGISKKLIGGRYSNRHYIALCSGFFPAQNPHCLATVVIENPENADAEGGTNVAISIFSDLAYCLSQYEFK